VLLVVPNYPDKSPFLAALFIGLLNAGWDVHLLCADGAADRLPPDISESVKKRVHFAPVGRPRSRALIRGGVSIILAVATNPGQTFRFLKLGGRRFGYGLLKRFYLDADIIRLRPSVVHFQFGPLARNRMHIGEVCGCGVVVSFRGYDLNYVGLDIADYYSEIWRDASVLHFLGEDLRRRATRRGFKEDKPVVLIPPAIDVSLFDPGNRRHEISVGSAERPLRVLSVGRLVWKKGYEFGLEAIALLVCSGCTVEYRIIGDGDYFEALAFARYQLGLESNVVFLLSRSPGEVRDEMLWADVLLHPAVSEGFCNAVVEAQAMRLPVVCTDADGLAENVEHGVTGFVVPRRDPAAMAGRLSELASDGKLRERMGCAGRERVTKRFRIEDQIAAFTKLYSDMN
jgi:colanic acid/amylovoran biosynthesis glycosyltransferase